MVLVLLGFVCSFACFLFISANLFSGLDVVGASAGGSPSACFRAILLSYSCPENVHF